MLNENNSPEASNKKPEIITVRRNK